MGKNKQNKTNDQTQKMKLLTAKPNILFFFIVNEEKTTKTGNGKGARLPMGKGKMKRTVRWESG